MFLHGVLWFVSLEMNHVPKPISLLFAQLPFRCMICMCAHEKKKHSFLGISIVRFYFNFLLCLEMFS